jgi:metallo-beta-lactamase family protein
MMRITFNGAAGEVTGSCHLLEAAGQRVLLDCGMIQGSREAEARNHEPFGFEPSSLDAVLLSHAHIDHVGRLPLLVKRGFRGPIFAHPATIDLSEIMLLDSASLAEADAERRRRQGRSIAPDGALYSRADVAQTMAQMRPLEYLSEAHVLPGVRVVLRDAGHILGSASVTVHADGTTLVFSGDIGPRDTPIISDPDPVPAADLVLLESTYGGRRHRARDETIQELGRVLDQAASDNGNVLIPAFAVGRSQELLYWFARHFDDWGMARFSIHLDAPMARKVIAVYAQHQNLFDADAQAVFARPRSPFALPNLHFSVSADESRALNQATRSIIIAGSGMCNGGRIRHHLRHHLPKPETHVVFVGYQGAGTLGRRLVDGAERVHIMGHEIAVRAQRHTVGGLSAHADHDGLMDWYGAIAGQPPVWLVHGEDPARAALADDLIARFGAEAGLAQAQQTIDVT